MTIITLPLRSSRQASPAEPLADAALEWERTNDQLEMLTEQINALATRRSALAGAAAANMVRREHPTASVLIFAVRDGRPRVLAQVLDGQGRILPARSTGKWAEDVLGTVINEDLTLFERGDGIVATSTSLRIELEQVIASASAIQVQATTPVTRRFAKAA